MIIQYIYKDCQMVPTELTSHRFAILDTCYDRSTCYKKFGAPRQNRTAITGLQNQCNAIILVGRVCLRFCYDLLNCFFVVQRTLNFCSVLGPGTLQQFGQLFYIHWSKSRLASLVFQWVVVCVKC